VSDSDDLGKDFKEFKAQCLAWFKKASQKRFKQVPNKDYRMDRWLMNLAMLTVFGWLFFIAQSYNYNLDFYQCGNSEIPDYLPQPTEECLNPFYKSGNAWKNQEYLPPGEYGQKPGPLFKSVFYSPFLIYGLAFFLNHIIHNRRRKK